MFSIRQGDILPKKSFGSAETNGELDIMPGDESNGPIDTSNMQELLGESGYLCPNCGYHMWGVSNKIDPRHPDLWCPDCDVYIPYKKVEDDEILIGKFIDEMNCLDIQPQQKIRRGNQKWLEL